MDLEVPRSSRGGGYQQNQGFRSVWPVAGGNPSKQGHTQGHISYIMRPARRRLLALESKVTDEKADKQIRIKEIRDQGKLFINQGDDKKNRRKELKIHLHSLDKRFRICEYHYDCFLDATDGPKIPFSRLGTYTDGHDVRVQYEAHSIAFLHCLHATVDSAPYGVNIVFNRWKKKKTAAFRDDFLDKFHDLNVHRPMTEIMRSEIFCKLKAIVESNKHRYLIRIKNDYRELYFEDFKYEFNAGTINCRDQPVKEFIEVAFNELMPKVARIYNGLLADIKSKLCQLGQGAHPRVARNTFPPTT